MRKIYFYDVGIRNALIDNLNPLSLRQDVGALWKNWVISERMKAMHNSGRRPRQYFWRTHAQQEIDYLEEEAGTLKAFELKWGDRNIRVPKAFKTAYPETQVILINRDNARDFLST